MNMLMNIQVPEYSASIALRIYEYAIILLNSHSWVTLHPQNVAEKSMKYLLSNKNAINRYRSETSLTRL